MNIVTRYSDFALLNEITSQALNTSCYIWSIHVAIIADVSLARLDIPAFKGNSHSDCQTLFVLIYLTISRHLTTVHYLRSNISWNIYTMNLD